jgi:hypothetical protein
MGAGTNALWSDLIQLGTNIGGGGLANLLGNSVSSLINGVDASDPVDTAKKMMDLTRQQQLDYARDSSYNMAGDRGTDALNKAKYKFSQGGSIDALSQLGVSGALAATGNNNMDLQNLYRKMGQERTGQTLNEIKYATGANAGALAQAARGLDNSNQTYGSMLNAKQSNDQTKLGALNQAMQTNLAGQQSYKQNRIDPYAVGHDQLQGASSMANKALGTSARLANQQSRDTQFSFDSASANRLASLAGEQDKMDIWNKLAILLKEKEGEA